MQLDFLTQLLHRTGAPPPAETLRRPQVPPRPAAKPAPDRPTPLDHSVLTGRGREILRAAGFKELADRVTVRWNPKMRSTAGTAFPARQLITLNPRLLTFGDAEVDRTLRHELAHLLAHHLAGRRRIAPHGPEWQMACRQLGLHDESRCHSLPLPRRTQTRRYHYACPVCGVRIARVRPLKKRAACLACCRKHNQGRYDERFRFVKALDPA